MNAKEKQIGKVFLIGILALFLIPFVSSVYSSANVAHTNPGLNSVQYMKDKQGINLFPILDEQKCGAGNDFILQISPTGCTPSVVRSDLLEEQNVPVFCPIYATKINPLIEVDSIKHIEIDPKTLPEGVAGIGFHPAQAALSSSQIPLTSSIFGNIGYAVVVLKKQKNESSMQDYVQGTITARIVTDVENAIGAGNVQYYVSEMDDNEWSSNYQQYSFWKGKGYLRLDSIDTNGAVVSVYRDENTVLSTRSLKEGETSTDIFMPGYYCPARFNIKLDKLQVPNSYAKINVNGDVFDVSEGEDFFENKCQLRTLEKVGVVEKITVQCQGDESSEKFDLISSPKIKLNINGKEGEYEVGQHLYENKEDTNEWIYLGAAFLENANDPNSLRIYLLKSSVHEEKLTDAELKSIFGIAKNKDVTVDNQGLVQIPGNILNAYLAQGTNLLKGIIEGKKIYSVKSSEGRMLFGNLVTITGFGEPLDKEINEDFKVYFEKAETNYRKLINEFPNEKITEVSGETYAENGFIELIELSSRTEQKAKMIELCREFKEKYPNSVDKVKETCDNSLKNSNSGISNRDILINGKLRTISFEGVYEPTYDQLGALIEIENARGFNDIRGMTKNQDMALSAEEYFKIKEIGENYVVVSVKVEEETVAGVVVKLNYNPDSIRIDLNDYKVVGENAYKISLRQINLKKSARIKILSRIENAETKANFTFKIGIEKRAIQLSPEKTKSRIENLNKQINKWENVSEKLDKTVSTMTKACFATDALLTLKNTFANNGLNSIARQKVMRDTNGWFDLCTKKVSEGKEGYNSVDDCLYKNANKIDADVNKMAEIMGKQNEQIKTIQEGAMKDVMIGKMVDDNKYVSEYLPKVRDSLPPTLEGVDINNLKNNILTIDGFGNGTFDKEDLRDMQLYSQIANSDASPELKAIANQDLQKTISGVSKNSESFIKIKSYQSAVSGKITGDIRVRTYTDQNKKLETYDGATTSSQFGDIPSGSAIQPISVDGIIYHVTLFSIGVNEYNIENVYDENGQAISENLGNEIKKKYSYFQMFDQTSYKNKITEAKIRYFETAPYKGYPAIVPFDVEKGWYAAVKQTLTGNLRAYDESGKVVSYYICNVGKNNKIEFDSGIGDDICEGINAQTKQVYNQFPGLESSETIKLVNDAVRAIEDAQRGYRSGVTSVNVRGKMISVGNPMTSVPEIQCQDFMSPKDCHILFNVCDPVMCPSSRCNLGGAYTVDNVAQTGIIGSVALCLPNYKEKILIPVCLTGVNNGVKGLLSMTKSYRDCLQESLDTGKTVGICDEIQSIYLCELAWREAAPLANIGIPKLLSIVFGQGTRGGGEYLGIASAWTKVQDSVTYFTQYYGVNAYKAFKARSTSEIGGELCKVYLSMKSPKNILDALAIPDSPVQYTARFDEIPFTTSTNPAISQYKVFYHIYAGQNEGAYYKVYLKSPTGTSLYQQNPTLLVAQGYIGIGQPATETKDFTAASDYKELCVSINTQEKCGFKQVSTSFAVDYITEKYIASQASKTNVKTEKECISSSTYDYGITRICATDNPGLGTDAKADAVGSRWISVGYCDSENLKCWLDTQSVKNIIDIKTIENATLSAVTDNYMNSLVNEAGFLSESQYQTESNKIKEVVGVRIGQGSTDSTKLKSAIENIDTIYTKILLINEKVQLLDFEARAYNKLARNLWKVYAIQETAFVYVAPASTNSEKCGAAVNYDYYDAPTTIGAPLMLCKSGTASTVKLSKDGTKWEWTCDGKPCSTAKTGATTTTGVKLSANADCQKEIGLKIIDLAREKKKTFGSDVDKKIKDEGIAENFECMVVQVAMQESSLQHCKDALTGKCLDCDKKDLNTILKARSATEQSYGVMQINIGPNAHPEMADKVSSIDESVNYGIGLLIKNYDASNTKKYYACKKEYYSGWRKSLRAYNGWGTDCSGTPNYVDEVVSQKAYVAALLPSQCGGVISYSRNLDYVNNCKDCGKGNNFFEDFANNCDKEECIAMGEKTGIACEFIVTPITTGSGPYYYYQAGGKEGCFEKQTDTIPQGYIDRYKKYQTFFDSSATQNKPGSEWTEDEFKSLLLATSHIENTILFDSDLKAKAYIEQSSVTLRQAILRTNSAYKECDLKQTKSEQLDCILKIYGQRDKNFLAKIFADKLYKDKVEFQFERWKTYFGVVEYYTNDNMFDAGIPERSTDVISKVEFVAKSSVGTDKILSSVNILANNLFIKVSAKPSKLDLWMDTLYLEDSKGNIKQVFKDTVKSQYFSIPINNNLFSGNSEKYTFTLYIEQEAEPYGVEVKEMNLLKSSKENVYDVDIIGEPHKNMITQLDLLRKINSEEFQKMSVVSPPSNVENVYFGLVALPPVLNKEQFKVIINVYNPNTHKKETAEFKSADLSKYKSYFVIPLKDLLGGAKEGDSYDYELTLEVENKYRDKKIGKIFFGEDYLESGLIQSVKFENKIGGNDYKTITALDYSNYDTAYLTIRKDPSKYRLDKFNVELEITDLKNNVIFSQTYTDKLGFFSDSVFRIELPKTIFNSVRSGDAVQYKVKVVKDNMYNIETGEIGVEK